MDDAGLNVRIDKVGNIFARREGRSQRGAIMVGSHLDSVINGGMFDGALGVIGALEAVRRVDEEGFQSYRPIEVAVYTGEEGSAFLPGLLGSSVLAGKLSAGDALSTKNGKGETLETALWRMGFKGDFEKEMNDVEYSLELHIEQGPLLHSTGVHLGIVENITGIGWIIATIQGVENHAGTTPMKMRKDALVAAADIVTLVNKRANELADQSDGSCVGTVGKLNVFPSGTNIVPGKVELGVDIRDVVKENMEKFMKETLDALKSLEERYGVKVITNVPITHMPTPLSKEVVDTIEKTAQEVGVTAKRMNSGAGHDSQNIAKRVKAGMIFVPSVNGISHSPMEWTEWEDIERGVKVLTQTIKNLSRPNRHDNG
jgi:N-carbamoyl-L-amino-acid hydrolase